MHTHANARLTLKGRLRLILQHLNVHRPLVELAAEAGDVDHGDRSTARLLADRGAGGSSGVS